jgi:hypothetical protein
MAEADASVLTNIVNNSALHPKYATTVDRESAYEMLAARHAEPGTAEAAAAPPTLPPPAPAPAKRGAAAKEPAPEPGFAEKILGSTVAKSMLRAGATAAAGAIVRSIFSTSKKR